MRSIVLLILASLASCQPAVTVSPSDLANFFASSNGLSMNSADAMKLATQEAGKLTQCGIDVSSLKKLRDTMYTTSGMDLSLTQVRQALLDVAYQQVTPEDLLSMYRTLYATDGVDLLKSDAQTRAIELAKKQVDASTLKSLYSTLYSISGLDLPKKDAQVNALELALAGANATQLKVAYRGFIQMGKTKQAALQAAIPEAVLAGFHGLARRHAQDTKPYTAAEFQDYYHSNWVSSWSSAVQEERVANDHHAYTIAEFDMYYKDSRYWTQAKTATQKRLAADGKAYTMEEFEQYYQNSWQQEFEAAPVLPCEECTSLDPFTINV